MFLIYRMNTIQWAISKSSGEGSDAEISDEMEEIVTKTKQKEANTVWMQLNSWRVQAPQILWRTSKKGPGMNEKKAETRK